MIYKRLIITDKNQKIKINNIYNVYDIAAYKLKNIRQLYQFMQAIAQSI